MKHLECSEDADLGALLTAAFGEFQRRQPALSERVAQVMSRPMDHVVTTVGLFIMIAIWSAFDDFAGHRLTEITDQDCENVEQVLRIDEAIRRRSPATALETEDVVFAQQPDVLAFVRARLDEAIRDAEEEVDMDDLDIVYRLALMQTLALSYALRPPLSWPSSTADTAS